MTATSRRSILTGAIAALALPTAAALIDTAPAAAVVNPELLAFAPLLEKAESEVDAAYDAVRDAERAIEAWDAANLAPELDEWEEGGERAAVAEYNRLVTLRLHRRNAALRKIALPKKYLTQAEAQRRFDDICRRVNEIRATTIADLIFKADLAADYDCEIAWIRNSIVTDLLDMGVRRG